MAIGNPFNNTAGISNPFANFQANLTPKQQVQTKISSPVSSSMPNATQTPNMSTVNGPAHGEVTSGNAYTAAVNPSMSSLHMFTKPIPELPKYQPSTPMNTNLLQTPYSKGIQNTSLSSMPTEVQQKIVQEAQTTNQSNKQDTVENKTPSQAQTLPGNTFPDLIASISTHPEATPEDIKKYFPELQGNENTFPDLIASIKSHPDATPEQIKQYFPELIGQQTNIDQDTPENYVKNNPNATVKEILEKYPDLEGRDIGSFFSRLKNNTVDALENMDKFGEGANRLLEKGLEFTAPGTFDTTKTTVSEDILNIGQGTLAIAQTAAAPGLMGGITVASSTKPGEVAMGAISKTFGTVGRVVNVIPGLSDFRDSLPEEKRGEFDGFVGNLVGSMLLGVKGKGNIIKDPKQFVIDNVGSKQIIDNFNQNVLGVKDVTVAGAKKVGEFASEKLNPGINLSEKSIQEAKKNPYVTENLNKIHETTDGKMSEVGKDYKDMAIKEVGDTYIKPELDAKIETYKEGGNLYKNIRDSKQPIDVNGLDVAAKKVADSYPQSSLTPTDTRNINAALKKVDDIMQDSKDGKFDISTALDTRQSFDKMIEWEGASAKGNEAVKAIRRELDSRMKSQVGGLTETDAFASKKINEIKEFKKQLINKEGNINYSNLKNVGNLSKTDLARRLDSFIPGATDRIEAIHQAVDIAKKTKGMNGLAKRGAKGLATLVGAHFGPVGAVVGYIIENALEGKISNVLSNIKQDRVLKFFNEMSPEAKAKLEEIGRKIENNVDISTQEKAIVEKAKQKMVDMATQKAEQQTDIQKKQDIFNQQTKALPSPETATPSNKGTKENPFIVGGQTRQVLEINKPNDVSMSSNNNNTPVITNKAKGLESKPKNPFTPKNK